jgi:Dolichyl-phosphate-mannose-protein mannosyltransferase
MAAVVLAFVALIISFSRGYLLLYGDAVAHLGIARRIVDSRNPGLSQLGGVWLPLPHLLMLPFIQKMEWWQNGLAGAWPSLLCYILGVIGFYRLVRRIMSPSWSFAATAFYALNPNLLYLATTAMTEALFLAILIWGTLLTMECISAMRDGNAPLVARRLIYLGLLIVAAVFTRYDGWVFGAAIWVIVSWTAYRHRGLWNKVAPSYVAFTALAAAGPIGWLAYNQHFFHDPLDFIRGPYSASAIEKRTTPPGSGHYPGWHNPLRALVLYTRTAQLDAAALESGFAVMALAIGGVVVTLRTKMEWPMLLLWMPLPFYVYSIAYGSVPIFIPPFWPHSYYNTRYGMELLPALAVSGTLGLQWVSRRLKASQPLAAKLIYPIMLSLAAVNAVVMMYKMPLVLHEAMANSTTRVAFESALARNLQSFSQGVPILMYNSDHIGAVQQAGLPLRQFLNEYDRDSWKAALAAPADKAAYVVAIAGDPVSTAVKEHPEGLTELTVLCTTGQPCARIYQSNRIATLTR